MTAPTPIGEAFLRSSRDYLMGDYLPRLRLVLGQLEDADLWWRGNAASNSIGNLVLHLVGNARQWIVAGVGGAPDTRDRAAEFTAQGGLSRVGLLAHLEEGMQAVDAALARVTVEQLLEPRRIQGIDTTVLGAIYHVVEHVATHTGQVVLLAKLRLGRDLGFWAIGPDGGARPTWRPPT